MSKKDDREFGKIQATLEIMKENNRYMHKDIRAMSGIMNKVVNETEKNSDFRKEHKIYHDKVFRDVLAVIALMTAIVNIGVQILLWIYAHIPIFGKPI